VQTGCFAGDTAGFPVTIDGTAGKSYQLTSDLVVPDENTNGIDVRARDVSIDLNGFQIARTGCELGTFPCGLQPGTGTGIRAAFSPSQDFPGTAVTNGTVVGMGLDGIRLSRNARVSRLQCQLNAGYGIRTFSEAIVSENIVHENGDDGIFVTSYSDVSGNVVHSNGGSGIDAGTGSSVARNTVSRNGFGTGGGFGLDLDATATYRENTIADNTTGGVAGGGVNLGGNYCTGTNVTLPTCP
jgi:hypothetical protein